MAERAMRDMAATGHALEPRSRQRFWDRKRSFLALALLLLLVGGLVAAERQGMELPLLAKLQGAMGGEAPKVEAVGAIFYEVPALLVNLDGASANASYLKIVVALELDQRDQARELDGHLPRIIDSFQVYLRALRVEDLQGSAGLQRLREELLSRVNAALPTTRIRDVLFKEMLIQ